MLKGWSIVDRRLFLPAASAMCGSLQYALAANPKHHKRFKVGQIGVAHGHASKISIYRNSEDYEVVGIVESDPKLREQVFNQPAFQGLNWMTQEQLLNYPGLDVVLVETAPRDSLQVAEAAISAGKHVHLDKPAGESLSHFQLILDQAAKQSLMLQMGYMYRYNPAVELLSQVIQQGWLGELFEVHAVMSKVLAASERLKLSSYPGGMMFELGCHLIDLVVALLGEPTAVTGYRRQVDERADSLFDNMLAVLEYPKALATIKSSGVEVEGFARRHLTVCGTEGTLHIQPLDRPAIRLALSQTRGPYRVGYQDIQLPEYTRYLGDAADMAAVLRGERPVKYSYQHDLAVQRTVLRASKIPLS